MSGETPPPDSAARDVPAHRMDVRQLVEVGGPATDRLRTWYTSPPGATLVPRGITPAIPRILPPCQY